ncbi:inner membrane protein YtfF [Salmonella enterica subsp. enterica serovar Choleraesuis]|nr:inner membrane protein YtfF [Salmonella enterica subsp. enterica serovar Choleraesuis]
MLRGVIYALLAGLMWGLIFIGPLLIPDYPALLLSTGRYLALGIIAIPLAWAGRQRLLQLSRRDWLVALRLSVVGNLIYYLCLAAAIQRTGAPIATIIIGTLPVVLPVFANLLYGRQDGQLPWRRLALPLLLLGIGVILVNIAELRGNELDLADGRYLSGILLALAAVVCWTVYALQNARWLRNNPDKNPLMWATAQGLVILPLSLLGYAVACIWLHQSSGFSVPLGPQPWHFIGVMLALAVFCSWIGALCWNQASQLLPTVILGPLIVFESLAGMLYTFLLRQAWPPLPTLGGILCLILGVVLAVQARPKAPKTRVVRAVR